MRASGRLVGNRDYREMFKRKVNKVGLGQGEQTLVLEREMRFLVLRFCKTGILDSFVDCLLRGLHGPDGVSSGGLSVRGGDPCPFGRTRGLRSWSESTGPLR